MGEFFTGCIACVAALYLCAVGFFNISDGAFNCASKERVKIEAIGSCDFLHGCVVRLSNGALIQRETAIVGQEVGYCLKTEFVWWPE